jgi:lipopolysaccharide transport system ATP-binding protein
MSDDAAIRLAGVGKMYKLFGSRADNLLDAVGFGQLFPWHRVSYQEFWALRGIELDLSRGARVGIIGRNGAGKTTLLKLITGNLAPTEGTLAVNGDVQALLEAGAGFHPDFTGYENIRASLVYQGLTSDEIDSAASDIAEFTELGEFLAQPLKTYSAGMHARLAFATATVVRPDVLIIDEILGAGDAYFLGKSAERMKQLVGSGATILLVSHSMAQITQICDRAIWLERGRVVADGPALDVVKTYERHIRELEDKRLRAKNARRRSGESVSTAFDAPEATVVVRFVAPVNGDGRCDISQVALSAGGEPVDKLLVGAPQDANPAHSGFVVLEGSQWSPPLDESGSFYRTLATSRAGSGGGGFKTGVVAFNVLSFGENRELDLEVDYRLVGAAEVDVELVVEDHHVRVGTLAPSREWSGARFTVALDEAEGAAFARSESSPAKGGGLSRWPGEGSLRIAHVDLLDEKGTPAAVFDVGSTLRAQLVIEASVGGAYDVLPVAVIYRIDGLNVTSQIGEWSTLDVSEGDRRHIELVLCPLNLGNGNYVLSFALYKEFDPYLNGPALAYDWIDRSLEFQVVGTPPAITSVFLHHSDWSLG